MAGVTWQVHRIGNERRDVTFLGVTTVLLGAGSGLAAAVHPSVTTTWASDQKPSSRISTTAACLR